MQSWLYLFLMHDLMDFVALDDAALENDAALEKGASAPYPAAVTNSWSIRGLFSNGALAMW